MKKIQCKLCGRDIEYEHLSRQVKCEHCGINAIFDECGTLVTFMTDDSDIVQKNETELSIIDTETNEVKSSPIPSKHDASQMLGSQNKATIKKSFKRPLIIALTLILCAIVIFSVSVFAYAQIKLTKAKVLIEKQQYDKAYEILMRLDIKEAKSLLKKLEWKYSSRIIKEGNQTAIKHEYKYNLEGQEVRYEVFYGRTMTEQSNTNYDDRGNVFVRTKFFPNTSYQMQEIHYYDNNDNLTHYVYQVNNVTQNEYFYEYDKDGNVTKETYASAKPYASYYKTYLYNESGKISEVTVFDSDGNIIAHSATEYDSLGNKTTEKNYSWTNSVSFTLTDTYEYDKYGNVIKEENYIYGTTRTCEYKYNKNGQILSEKSTNNNDKTTFIEYFYSYNGLLNKIISQNSSGDVTEKHFEYDKYGNLISETTINDTIIISKIEYANYICFYHP